MAKSENQKSKLLALRDIFLRESDQRHPITCERIVELLAARGISAERKSLYDDFEVLRRNGLEVEKSSTRPVGYYVEERELSLPELKLLTDAVAASRFITNKKSEELIGKLVGLTSRHNASRLRGDVFVANRVKAMNESIYYNIDAIHEAISDNRQITFKYFNWSLDKERVARHDGQPYKVSPQALVWDDENYYLVAYDPEAGILKHYRVDKMASIAALPDKREGTGLFDKTDIALYSRAVFGMFGGQTQQLRLLCNNAAIGVIIDRFGKNIPIIREDNEHFSTFVTVVPSQQFNAWVFSLGGMVKIISPQSAADALVRQAESVAAQYR